jgi:adenosylmethionine-8-amino-7-oxononanoate aminotransferase
MTRDAVYQAFYDEDVARGFLHSHSYTGNPLACRAALATLDLFEEERVIEANRVRRSRITAAARPIAQHPRIRNFRNSGMIWAFEVETADASFARRFFSAALERELLLRPLGNTVYFMPPYVIGEDEIELLTARTAALLDALPPD